MFDILPDNGIEKKIRQAAGKAGLTENRIFEACSMCESYAPPEDDDSDIAEIAEKAKAFLDSIEKACAAAKPLARSKKALASDVDRLVRKMREGKLEKAGLGKKLLEKISNAVLPGGKPQERVANILQFLNLYGPDLVRLSIDNLDPFGLQHSLVMISAGRNE